VPAASARTIAATEPAAQPRRAPRFADNTTTTDPIRLLTSRPTSDPAAPPSTHPSPTIATPISILARPNESRADAEHRRQDTADTPPVEVIIDRIDVRLPSAPQPPLPPRSGPRAPMSLERYLESRENSPGRRTP
jgi:hypothetical protein